MSKWSAGLQLVRMDKNSGAASWRLKMTVMVLLCAQNSAYALLRRYSQGVVKEPASPSSMLLIGEVIKLFFSLFVMAAFPQYSAVGGPPMKMFTTLMVESMPLLVPAIVYLLMNLLSYVALENIDAGLFTVCAQAKVLTTAVCAVLFLKKRLNGSQWRALLLLVFGAVLISEQQKPVHISSDENITFLFWVGLAAVIAEVTLSGFVSVYFEKVLKSSPLTVWDRNLQLAVWSIIIYFPIALSAGPIFHGWSSLTWMVALLGAAGGILVAMTLRYMDAIVKCFGASGAIVVTTLLGHAYMGARLNLAITIGAAMVILSMFNYNDASLIPASGSGSSSANSGSAGAGAGGSSGSSGGSGGGSAGDGAGAGAGSSISSGGIGGTGLPSSAVTLHHFGKSGSGVSDNVENYNISGYGSSSSHSNYHLSTLGSPGSSHSLSYQQPSRLH